MSEPPNKQAKIDVAPRAAAPMAAAGPSTPADASTGVGLGLRDPSTPSTGSTGAIADAVPVPDVGLGLIPVPAPSTPIDAVPVPAAVPP